MLVPIIPLARFLSLAPNFPLVLALFPHPVLALVIVIVLVLVLFFLEGSGWVELVCRALPFF